MAGLAVVVPRLAAMAALVERDGVGCTYEPGNPADLGRAHSTELATDRPRLDAMKRRGPQARTRALQRRGPGARSARGLGPLVCGICGVVALGRPPETETVEAMMAALAHRGPDGEARTSADGVALGHLRLAIIDLSDAGLQPFASDDGTLQLIHNGEIYNYLELRAELEAKGHRFRSATDTEVDPRRVPRMGRPLRRALQRHVGVRALGRAAPTALLLARPLRREAVLLPLGRRPFRLRERAAGVPRRPRHHPAGRTSAPSATSSSRATPTISTRRSSRESATCPPPTRSSSTPTACASRATGSSSRDAEPATRPGRRSSASSSSTPSGSACAPTSAWAPRLSGGLDSSAIACAIDHLLRDRARRRRLGRAAQQTFTAYFEDAGFDERPYAEAVVARDARRAALGLVHGRAARRGPADVVEAQGEPFGSTSIVAQWYVMRGARAAGVKVMLDGQGGDEVLAGYPTTFPYLLADLVAAGRLARSRPRGRCASPLQGASARSTAQALVTPFLPGACAGASAAAAAVPTRSSTRPSARSTSRRSGRPSGTCPTGCGASTG